MDNTERKKATVITKYAVESFSEGDWLTLGQLTGKLNIIRDHPRLFRSMSFGDDDYELCATEVIDSIVADEPDLIESVIDHFDIDLWYQQREPEKFRRVFEAASVSAHFWTKGFLKLFVCHLSSNKDRLSHLKSWLETWGISAFLAHEDIEPSKEWRDEVEAALHTMEALIAVVEPGFKESDWCCQEVGFALGRKIEVIPLSAGLDPFGFFGKYQAIRIKGKIPEKVAEEITKLLLKKPKHREKLLRAINTALRTLPSDEKIKKITILDSWSVATDDQLRALLEGSSLSSHEQDSLRNLLSRVGAFAKTEQLQPSEDDDIPF